MATFFSFRKGWQKIALPLWLLILFVSEALPWWNTLNWRPHFLLIAIYYLALYRTSALSLTSLFIISLLRDGYFGFPLGNSSVIYLIIFLLGNLQRSFYQTPHLVIDWLGFIFMSSLASGLHWVILGIFQKSWVPSARLFIGALLTSCLYPIGTWLTEKFLNPADRPWSPS